MKNSNRSLACRAGIAALAALVFTTGPAVAQSDPLLGAWEFVADRSRVEPGPMPYRSMTLRFSPTERGLKNSAQGIDADGRSIRAEYMIVPDGKYYPVTGSAEFDSSSYTPVSDRVTVYVRRKVGTPVIAGSRVLSRDGETLTFSEKTVDAQGRETGKALLVFERL